MQEPNIKHVDTKSFICHAKNELADNVIITILEHAGKKYFDFNIITSWGKEGDNIILSEDQFKLIVSELIFK